MCHVTEDQKHHDSSKIVYGSKPADLYFSFAPSVFASSVFCVIGALLNRTWPKVWWGGGGSGGRVPLGTPALKLDVE